MPTAVATDDVIAAVATAAGPAVRGAVRVSGPDAVATVARLVPPALPDAATPWRVEASFATAIGDVPVTLLGWPTSRSYCGQPTVEIHTVGSPPLLDAICDALFAAGARPARPGEFTMRAYLNGRIDLAEAEAVRAVIEADDRHDLDAALKHLAGGPSRRIAAIRNRLVRLLAEIEAALDFADEDLELITTAEIAERIAAETAELSAVAGDAAGRTRADAIPTVAFVGPPNAGKSSLVNALAGRDAAIVADVSGTTRDAVSVRTTLTGHDVELVDTAGAETPRDELTAAMADAARDAADRATLIVRCFPVDSAARPPEASSGRELVVFTKADLASAAGGYAGDVPAVSVVDGRGLDDLRNRIASAAFSTVGDRGITLGARTAAALGEAVASLKAGATINRARGGPELVAAELRAALDALAVISGAVDHEDVLDVVFGSFCIGK